MKMPHDLTAFFPRDKKPKHFFFTIIVPVAIAYGLFFSCSANSSSLQDIAFPSDTTDILRVFYAPFDAPFIRGDYSARINSILLSLDSVGQSSFLTDPPVLAYNERLSIAPTRDYALSPRGKALLDENKKWLVDIKGRQTPGYLRFSQTRARISEALQAGRFDEARELILHFFSDVQAFRYINAEQLVKTLSPGPVRRIYEAIRERRSGAIDENSYLLFPRPDDLDIAENWKPIVLRTYSTSGGIVGLGTYIQVFISQADHVLENLVQSKKNEPFYLPRRLLFVKSLQYSPSLELIPVGAQILDIPADKFNIYRNSSSGSTGLFLLAVEMEKCAF